MTGNEPARRFVQRWLAQCEPSNEDDATDAMTVLVRAAVDQLVQSGHIVREAAAEGALLRTAPGFASAHGVDVNTLLRLSAENGHRADRARKERDAAAWFDCLRRQAASGQTRGTSAPPLSGWHAGAWLSLEAETSTDEGTAASAVEIHRDGTDENEAAAELAAAIRARTIQTAQPTDLTRQVNQVRFLTRTERGVRWLRISHVWMETPHSAALAAFSYDTTAQLSA